LAQFLRERSRTPSELRRELRPDGPKDEPEADLFGRAVEDKLFGTQMLAFKRRPLLRLADGQELVLDVGFLSDLAVQGPFWSVFDGLEGRLRPDFLSLWGRVLELYVSDLLRQAYPASAGVLRLNVAFDRGEVDALLDFGHRVVIIECKSAFLPQEAKYRRDRQLLERELRAKFFEDDDGPKAVRQLAAAVDAIGRGAVRTQLPPRTRKILYPVLVGLEPGLESFGVNVYLDRLFQQVRAESPEGVSVRPLTVMSVEELETILPAYDAGLSWWELLDERYGAGTVPIWSVGQPFYEIGKESGVVYGRNAYLLEALGRAFGEIN